MANTTIGFGAALIVLGLAGYFGSGMASPTALIPAAVGLLLAVFGAMARQEARRKLAMHLAVGVGLIGLLGVLPRPLKALAGGKPFSFAIASQLAMAALLLVFVALCVRSFIEARRARG